jgi:quercetin dioxygenase-like cupin family protein
MTDQPLDPRSAPAGVADLVDYQPDAIVSRIVLKTPTGSITVFAFDAGQSLSEHRVPHSVLVHALDGEVELTVDGTVHQLRPGEALLMAPDAAHTVRASQRFKMMLTMLRA